MGSTPIHGIPFADPTDLVRDWPALSEDVALAIEAALEDISVPQKRIEAFTGSGTFVVPDGVTYAIAHMLGGGGGGGGETANGSNGSNSSVAFTSGTVSSLGAAGGNLTSRDTLNVGPASAANSGRGGHSNRDNRSGQTLGRDAQWNVAGAAVTPAQNISVTVGAGGAPGSGGRAGGSGYVYIEYFEEV